MHFTAVVTTDFGEEFEQPKPGNVKASVHLFLRKTMIKLEFIMHC